MNTTTTRAIALVSNRELQSITVCALLVSLFAGYVYFVSAAVVHVVIRTEMTSQISQMNSEISKLEAEYIKRQHAVSSDVANQKGFIAVRDKIFLDRTDTTLVLSNNR